MNYSIQELSEIKSRIYAKVTKEIEIANKNNEIEIILEKYGVVLEEEERMPINTRTYRILIIGQLAGSKKDYQLAAKKLGISPNNLEFYDYNQAKTLNATKLEYSNEYSDIIFGPMPHKISEMGDTSSLIALIERNPMKYPRMIRSKSNSLDGGLKISITGFKEYLQKTYYYETMHNIY